jgi:hypothetical protein
MRRSSLRGRRCSLSGIAHADENDPKLPERETRLAQLKRVVIVAPGLVVPANMQSIAFVSPTHATPSNAIRIEGV